MSAGERGRVPRHRLVAKLEQGGMAEVYLAILEDRLDTRSVRVVKIMPKSLAADPTFAAMFLDEARLAMRLSHPNVVQTVEVGKTTDGSLYLAMEWLEGASLFRFAQRCRSLDEDLGPTVAASIVLGLLDALHHLHELRALDGTPLNAVHRDITPSNVFVTVSGHVKLLDFGVAKTSVQTAVTVVGTRKGKLGYLAPEVIAGGEFDRRSDVYTVGVVLWELLAGRRLWRGAGAGDRREPALRLDTMGLGIPAELSDVCARALAREAADRYPTALAMREELESATIAAGGVLRSQELAQRVEQLFGEDVRHIRRLAANAIRTGREDLAGERMVLAPEGTSVTVHPAGDATSGRLLVRAGALVAFAGAVAMVSFGLVSGSAPTVGSSAAIATAFSPASVDSAGEEPEPTMTLRVDDVPVGGIVEIDGLRVAGPPFHAVFTASRDPRTIRISAPGHVDRVVVVVAEHDLRVDGRLEALRDRRVAPGGSPPAADGRGPTPPPPPPRPPTIRSLDPSDPW